MSETYDAEFVESGPEAAVMVRPAASAAPAMTGAFAALAAVDLSTEDGLQTALTIAGNALRLQEAILNMVVKMTTEDDWDDLGGKPALSEAACERMLSAIGAEVKILSEHWEWDDEVYDPAAKQFRPDRKGHFGVRIHIQIRNPLFGTRDGIGMAHSSDQFLGTKGDEKARAIADGADPEKTKGRLLGDVSRHNIYQHAFTRAKGNATRKAFGASGRKWETLRKVYGLGEGLGAKVEFGKKPGPSGQTREGPRPPTPEEKAEQAKVKADAAADEERAKLKKMLGGAMKKRSVSFGQATEHARKAHGYDGDKILEAPTEILRLVLADLDAGKLVGEKAEA